MNTVLSEMDSNVLLITLNRVDKHNAFDDAILIELKTIIDKAEINPKVHVIVLKANGKNFSAGADLAWMQRMANFSEAENLADAKILASLMFTLYSSKKPTIAMVQGKTFGGGVGLIAACDIAITSTNAEFCFSEVKLGLTPAVISPYIIKAIGERATNSLFISAELFNAKRAFDLGLVQYCIEEEDLLNFTLNFAKKIAELPCEATIAAKSLVRKVSSLPINDELQSITAAIIAKQRVSNLGQNLLKKFFNKGSKK
jgi:methylglutaconyl-CoA hydratase